MYGITNKNIIALALLFIAGMGWVAYTGTLDAERMSVNDCLDSYGTPYVCE